MTVSLVARHKGVQANQLFHWRKLARQGALTATSADGEVIAESENRALQNQVHKRYGNGLLNVNIFGD